MWHRMASLQIQRGAHSDMKLLWTEFYKIRIYKNSKPVDILNIGVVFRLLLVIILLTVDLVLLVLRLLHLLERVRPDVGCLLLLVFLWAFLPCADPLPTGADTEIEHSHWSRPYITALSLVETLHYCALIGRELHSLTSHCSPLQSRPRPCISSR